MVCVGSDRALPTLLESTTTAASCARVRTARMQIAEQSTPLDTRLPSAVSTAPSGAMRTRGLRTRADMHLSGHRRGPPSARSPYSPHVRLLLCGCHPLHGIFSTTQSPVSPSWFTSCTAHQQTNTANGGQSEICGDLDSRTSSVGDAHWRSRARTVRRQGRCPGSPMVVGPSRRRFGWAARPTGMDCHPRAYA